jgi:hypothetical protein
MAAPTPTDPRDLDAVPTFLRARTGSAKSSSSDGAGTPGRSVGVARSGSETLAKATRASEGSAKDRLGPAALPLPGLSRRRLATVAGIVAATWLVLAFGRQVGDATAASTRADALRAGNVALRQDVSTLQQDLARVQDDRFIRQQGRQYGLGGPGEIPFSLAADAPPLAADAPGSAAVRLGAVHDQRSTLDVWLSTLFGG